MLVRGFEIRLKNALPYGRASKSWRALRRDRQGVRVRLK
jgi:hypothetical protein